MEKFKLLKKELYLTLPKNSGVYVFKNGRKLLYIGKAINIRRRVKNHFKKENYRDNLFMNDVNEIGYIVCESEIEALILEATLIKKYQPKYNIVWRDDKNFFFVGVTKEKLPQIFITHQPEKKESANWWPAGRRKKAKIEFIGPFVEGKSLKRTLKILRKIFPYYTTKKHKKTACAWCHLKLCPGPNPDQKEYQKNIKNLVAVLKGRKKTVLRSFKKKMRSASETQDYEKAANVRNKIKSLEIILSHAKIFERERKKRNNWKKTQKILKKILKIKKRLYRIEAYDISNIQGQKATGSMATFILGEADKSLYRKFKIKISGKPNDTAMIKEVLDRRLKHPEWNFPDIILVDGGIAQLNAAIKAKNQYLDTLLFSPKQNSKNRELQIKNIKIISLAKRKNQLYIEGRKKPLLLEKLPRAISNLILQLRDEAHRFAITYHKKLRLMELIN